jgi:hypothetical protein
MGGEPQIGDQAGRIGPLEVRDHPREMTLELYVLGSESMGEDEREGIARHLERCAGCREIAGRMEEYYAELRKDLAKFDDTLPVLSPDELPVKSAPLPGRRAGDRPAVHEVDTRLPFRVARWITRHPIAASAGTLFSFGLIAGLLFLALPEREREVTDINPTGFTMSGRMIVLRNNFGQEVGTIEGTDMLATVNANDPAKLPDLIQFVDADGDGVNEVVWYEATDGTQGWHRAIRCESLRPGMISWQHKIGGTDDYPGHPEAGGAIFSVQQLTAGDFDGTGGPELYALLPSGSFPAQIIKLDAARGGEIGRYRHVGGLATMRFVDIDGDTVPEIIAGGTNNSFGEAVVAILDPREISGQSPYRGDYGAAGVLPADEKAYIRFPRTIAGLADRSSVRNTIREINVDPANRNIRVSVIDNTDGVYGNADYHVNMGFDLSIGAIERGDGYNLYTDSLIASGSLSFRPDGGYFGEYRKTISWWDGAQWVHHPTWNLKNTRITASAAAGPQ